MVDLVKRMECAGRCHRVLPLSTKTIAWWRDDDEDPNLLFWGPDPYQSDVDEDQTPVWQCDPCRYESAMDI